MAQLTRRETIAALGATGTLLAVGSGTAAGASESFERTASPTAKTLRSVTHSGEGPYAVADNGDVLARRAATGTDSPYELILDAGLTGGDKSFYGIDAAADGRNVWLAGESGRVGYYDTVDEQFTDYSKPNGRSTTWLDIAAAETDGSERVYLFGDGGEVLVGQRDGPDVSWGSADVFNGGNAIYGAARLEENEVFCCDSTGSVYHTTDGGDNWADIGIDSVSDPLYDIEVASETAITAVGSAGCIAEYDGSNWTTFDVGSSTVQGVAHTAEGRVAAGDGGRIYVREEDGWTVTDMATSKTLRDVSLDTTGSYPDIVAGNAGYIYERDDYTAYPDSIELRVDSGVSLDYSFDVSGPARKTDTTENGDDLTETADGYTADGSLPDGDTVDGYRFGGDISGLTVTDGSVDDLTTVRSGTEVSVERLADRTWSQVSTPIDVSLYEVVESSNGLYAVGESGRIVHAPVGEGWRVETKTGVTGGGNTLYGAGVTDDGAAVWVAGGSGTLGRVDAATGEITDYSKPGGSTSTFTDIAVVGSDGKEEIYLTNGSGEVFHGENDRGTLTFDEPIKPGNGSTIRGITFIDDDFGYVCDGNSAVYETTDGGDSWTDIGIDGAGVTLYDVSAVARDDITVVGGSGRLFRYNGAVWTLSLLGGNSRLSVDRDADRGVAVGGSAQLFEREIDGWTETYENSSDVTLYSSIVVRNDDTVSKYAVGGNGVALEQTFDDPLF